MPANNGQLEKRLGSAADELRANSKLESSEYSVPVLGSIFLKYADYEFAQVKAKLTGESTGRRTIGKTDHQAQGVLYLAENEDLKEVLPKTYNKLDRFTNTSWASSRCQKGRRVGSSSHL